MSNFWFVTVVLGIMASHIVDRADGDESLAALLRGLTSFTEFFETLLDDDQENYGVIISEGEATEHCTGNFAEAVDGTAINFKVILVNSNMCWGNIQGFPNAPVTDVPDAMPTYLGPSPVSAVYTLYQFQVPPFLPLTEQTLLSSSTSTTFSFYSQTVYQ